MFQLLERYRKPFVLIVASILVLSYGCIIRGSLSLVPLRMLMILPLILITWTFGSRIGNLSSLVACLYAAAVFAINQFVIHHLAATFEPAFTALFASLLIFAVPYLFGRIVRSNQALRRVISEKEITQRVLFEQRAYFEAVVKALPDLLFEYDRSGEYISFGGHHTELLYRPESELKGRTVFDLLPKDAAGTIMEAIAQASVRGSDVGKPYKLLLPAGLKYFEPSIAVIGDIRDPNRHFLMLSRDVTDRVLAEERLAESEKHYHDLFDRAPFGYFRATVDGKTIAINQKAARIHGFDSSQEMMEAIDHFGFSIYENPGDRAKIMQKAVETDGWRQFENRYRKRDGSSFIGRLLIRSYKDALLQTGEVEGFVEDITEIKTTQSALETSNAHLQAVLNALPDVLFEIDRSGRYISLLGRTDALIAYRPLDKVIGHTIEDILPKDASDILLRDLSQAALRGFCGGSKYKLEANGKTYWFESSIVAIGDIHLPDCHFVLLARNITERVSLENQLIQSQKMEAVGRLAGGIAHDFNNILQVILGFCELISQHPEEKENVLKGIDVINDSAKRAASLTMQLLTFSRRQKPDMRVISPSKLILDMQPMLKRTLGEDINLKLNLHGSESLFEADEGQFQQIIMNLAVNARDAMPSGGNLIVDIRDTSTFEDSLQGLPQPLLGDYIQISVSDSGIGMTEDVLSHLFEPFFTTKEVGKGTGLGLSIVYAIVKQFNGYVTVQSELSKGTVFHLYFPKASGRTSSSDESVPDVPSFLGSETILLVEDEQAVQSLVLSALKTSGYIVFVANNGKEALSIMESTKTKIDLLITDVVMPDIRGNLVAEQFRRKYPNAPVIFMSGYSEQTLITEKQDAAISFLQKPFSIKALLNTIKRLIEARAV